MRLTPRRYMRTIAYLGFMTTAIYSGLVLLPDVLSASMADLVEPRQAIPRFYTLAIFLLSFGVLQKPVRTRRSRQTIRGILEGSIVAYVLISAYFLIGFPERDIDGSFRYLALYASLGVIGPLLSGLGAIARIYRIRSRQSPTSAQST